MSQRNGAPVAHPAVAAARVLALVSERLDALAGVFVGGESAHVGWLVGWLVTKRCLVLSRDPGGMSECVDGGEKLGEEDAVVVKALCECDDDVEFVRVHERHLLLYTCLSLVGPVPQSRRFWTVAAVGDS